VDLDVDKKFKIFFLCFFLKKIFFYRYENKITVKNKKSSKYGLNKL